MQLGKQHIITDTVDPAVNGLMDSRSNFDSENSTVFIYAF
jgi:hypothetical protein